MSRKKKMGLGGGIILTILLLAIGLSMPSGWDYAQFFIRFFQDHPVRIEYHVPTQTPMP